MKTASQKPVFWWLAQGLRLGVCVCTLTAVQTYAQGAQSPACPQLQAADLMQLTLPMALDNALCANPSMRQAMLAVAERQAGVDLAKSANRPRVNAGGSVNANRSAGPGSNSDSSAQTIAASLGLSWILFDFGLRDATLAQNRAQLSGAMANLSNTQLNAVGETLRLYVDALTVWLRLDSLRQAELVAEQSLRAASAKYEVQVGSLAEKLQAQTAYAQNTLERVRANGQWETARAALAVHMGFGITQRMGMPGLDTAVPFVEAATNIDDMLTYVREQHPRLRALQAEVDAQRLRGDAVVAEGRGSVSVNANAQLARAMNRSGGGFDRSVGAGVVANIPLFNGEEQDARLAQNNAQTDTKISQIEGARRELETELLRQVLTVQTEIETRLAARALLQSAEQNHQVALGRYRGGVGTIVDLLSAQAALSAARLALDQSYLAQASARLRLATVVGKLPGTVVAK
ncbi:MAG: TolC family protein [Burkholderiaceae bacterium]